MKQNEIKEWLISRLESKGRRSMMISIRNSIHIQNILKSFTNFLPDDCPYTQRAWHIINNSYEILKCKECKKSETAYSHRTENWGYLTFCSTRCASSNEDIQNKVKSTSIERFGASNVYASEWFKNHYKKTMIERYGVEHNWNTKESKENRRKTIEIKRKEWLKNLPDRELYYETVIAITNKQLYHFGVKKFGNLWWERRGRTDHHIDHMYSIKKGFENNVPPYIIGSIHNLDLIPYKENLKKQYSCTITIDEILNEIIDINRFESTLSKSYI